MFKILYTVTIFIGIIILLRALCKNRISARLQYALWLLVAVKLLVFPMPNVEGDFSVLGIIAGTGQEELSGMSNSKEELLTAEENGLTATETQAGDIGNGGLWSQEQMAGEGAVPGTDTGVAPEYIGPAGGGLSGFARWWDRTVLRLGAYVENVLKVPFWLVWILCTGSLLCAAWMVGYHVRLYRYLRRKRVPLHAPQEIGDTLPVGEKWAGRERPSLYSVEGLPTPCLFGRSIYIPADLAGDAELLPYMVRHEACHYSHGDILWGFLRMLCVCLYWYHPLVWVSAYLSRQDCELACDEAVVKDMEGQERKRYGELLLSFAAVKSSPAECLSLTTAMSGSAKQLKQRLERITGRKKGLMAFGLFAVAAAILGIYACMTNGFVQTDRQWQSIRIREQEESVSVLQESYGITYRLSRDAASYGLYMEQYEYGELVSAEVLDFAPLRPEGDRSRKIKRGEALFTRALEADEETGAFVKSAASYSVQDYSAAQADGASSAFKAFTLKLPEVRCIGNSFSGASKEQLEHRFQMNEDIILLADYYGDGNGLSVPARHYFAAEKYGEEVGEIIKDDRCVILTHLIVSDQTVGELEKQLEELVQGKKEGVNTGAEVSGSGDALPVDAENGYSDEELFEMAEHYYRMEHVFAPAHVEIDSEEGDSVVIWLYDTDRFLNEDGEMTGSANTRDWYTVDRRTGRGENVLFEEIDLTEAGPMCRPWEEDIGEKRVVDVSREEDFQALPPEPEAGAEDSLYLLGETAHFALYGTWDYGSVIWQEGDSCTEIDIPFVVDGITMMAPDMQEADYDGDGEAELAVKLLWGEGTGLWEECLWMFDREAGKAKACEYHAGDYEEALLKQLSWEETDGARRLVLEEMPVTPLLREEDGVSYKEAGINTGRVSFAFEDGKIKLRTLLWCGSREGSVMPAYGDAVLEAEVRYAKGGEFSLEDVVSADLEDAKRLAEEAVREFYAPREITFAEEYHLGSWRFSEDAGEQMEMTLGLLTEGEDSYDFAEVPLAKNEMGAWEAGEILIQK